MISNVWVSIQELGLAQNQKNSIRWLHLMRRSNLLRVSADNLLNVYDCLSKIIANRFGVEFSL